MVNAANQGANYSQEQALQDFAVGFIGDLAGGGIGELTGKYGARAVARGLGRLGLDAKKIDNLTGILDWNFSSSDPLVGDLANSIDNQFGKGTVSDVGEGFETATSSGDLDIVTEKFNIEVKSGRKIKLTQSQKNKAYSASQGKGYILYNPRANKASVQQAAKKGITVVRNMDELSNIIGN